MFQMIIYFLSYVTRKSLLNSLRVTTRLPPSRSSSIGPEGWFLFFHPKVSVKEVIILNQTQLILTNRIWDNQPVYLVTKVTMGPVGLMKSTIKQKLFAIIGFFLEFFSWLILTSGSVQKSFGGWVVGGGVVFLNIVSSPGPGFVKVRARFGQVVD